MKTTQSIFDRRNKRTREGWAIVRVSTVERGRTQHGSLEAQETMIRRWEKAIQEETGIPYNIVKIIEEKASAKSENTHRRRELLQLVRLIELGAIDFIVVEKLDRLSRDEVFNLELMKKITDYNVELFFIEGGKMDFRNQGDRWRFKIDNIRAGEYSADLSEKILRKQRIAMVEAGKDPSPTPILGLNKHQEMAGKYEVEQSELRTVVEIMGKFCEFGGSREGTLKFCKDNNILSKKWWTEKKVDENGKIIKPRLVGGDRFTWNSLMTLLCNPKYRGFNQFYDSFHQYPDRQDKNGFVTWEYYHHRVHGDIIDPDLLKKVDDLAVKTGYKSRESEFFLSGILFAKDGSRFGGEYTKKKAYYYNRKLGDRFGSEHLHKRVLERLKQYVLEEGLLEKLLLRTAGREDIGLPKIEGRVTAVECELKKTIQASDNFSEAIRNAAVQGEKNLADVVCILLKEKEQADRDKTRLESELARLLEEREEFRKNFNGTKLKEYLRLVLDDLKSLHPLEQKFILRTLIPKGIIQTSETESTLELHVHLDPKAPLPVKGAHPLSTIPSKNAKLYKFPELPKSRYELPLAARVENEKGRFSLGNPRGQGEEKWPYVRYGRRGGI